MGEKNVVKITEGDLRTLVKKSVIKILTEAPAMPLNYAGYEEPQSEYGEINEMARINVKEPKGAIFPYEDFDVHIWSNDHEPAHFHIITSDWNVEFLISGGQLYKVKEEGKDKKILKYMSDNVAEWLSSPCAALPTITNYDNANLQWIQLHPPKQ